MPPSYQPTVFLDGVLQEAAIARVSPLSDGFLLGFALFETVKVKQGRPVFLAEHAARLRRGAAALGLSLTDEASLGARCGEVLRANEIVEGSVKVVVFRDGTQSRELILVRAYVYPDEMYRRGYRLITQRDARTSARGPAHKSTNYLVNTLAREEARRVGADEALFVDPDEQVLEGAGTNVFAVIGGEVLTPPAAMGILPGVARGQVLAFWGARGARERMLSRKLLEAADEVFVTNSLLGVMPVASVDGRSYPVDRAETTRALMAEYRTWEEASVREASLPPQK